MKSAAEKAFVRAGRRREALYADEVFALVPREYAHRVSQIDGACSMIFDIVDIASHRVAGEIALRLGEGESLYYLGHIGYHIDPAYVRARSWAVCLKVQWMYPLGAGWNLQSATAKGAIFMKSRKPDRKKCGLGFSLCIE